MDIPLNAQVKCADGEAGRTVCIVMNPLRQEITHVVVKSKGPLGLEYLVPLELISGSSPHYIRLRCTRHALVELKPFVRSEFIGPEDTTYGDYLALALATSDDEPFFWPYAAPEAYGLYVTAEQIPPDELAIRRGAHVEARDGRVGMVDEFIVNPQNNHIAHLVIREGHLWNKKAVTIPVAEIERIEDNTIYLKSDKQTLLGMPGIPR